MNVLAFRQTGGHAGPRHLDVAAPETARAEPPQRQPTLLDRVNDRLPAILLTLLLQAGLLVLLLHSFRGMAPPEEAHKETYLRLPRLIEPRTAPPVTIDARGVPRPLPPLFVPPVRQAPSAAPPAIAAPDLRSFGRALNDCAPENLANLPKELRDHCPRPGEGLAIRQAPPLMGQRSHVRDEARWREELAREHSAALMPCGGFANILCVLSKVADGTLGDYGDPRTWPRYEVEQIAPEDFYRIEKAYDEWHEAHPDARAH